MYQAVVETAQLNEIVQCRLTPLGPMLDVVPVQIGDLSAARKTAAPVTGVQGALNGRGEGAGAPPDRERLASEFPRRGRAFEDSHPGRIAAEPPGGFNRHRGAPVVGSFELTHRPRRLGTVPVLSTGGRVGGVDGA